MVEKDGTGISTPRVWVGKSRPKPRGPFLGGCFDRCAVQHGEPQVRRLDARAADHGAAAWSHLPAAARRDLRADLWVPSLEWVWHPPKNCATFFVFCGWCPFTTAKGVVIFLGPRKWRKKGLLLVYLFRQERDTDQKRTDPSQSFPPCFLSAGTCRQSPNVKPRGSRNMPEGRKPVAFDRSWCAFLWLVPFLGVHLGLLVVPFPPLFWGRVPLLK